jgi:hypothetical protein
VVVASEAAGWEGRQWLRLKADHFINIDVVGFKCSQCIIQMAKLTFYEFFNFAEFLF